MNYMFASLRPDFNLKRLVTFIVALWLQVTVLIIFCCIAFPPMSGHSDKVDAFHPQAVNGA